MLNKRNCCILLDLFHYYTILDYSIFVVPCIMINKRNCCILLHLFHYYTILDYVKSLLESTGAEDKRNRWGAPPRSHVSALYNRKRFSSSKPPNRFWGPFSLYSTGNGSSYRRVERLVCEVGHTVPSISNINPYPTAFPYGNGMVLHFYQQQESNTTKTVHKIINKGLKTYV